MSSKSLWGGAMRIYSHSALKLFQRCQLKWKYRYIDRLEVKPEDRPKYFERGSNIHAILEAAYGPYVEKLDEAIAAASPEDVELIERYFTKWDNEDEGWKVLSVEEEFHLEIGDHKLVFIPDLIVQIGDDVWVVDHKTTANIPDEWDEYNMTDFQHLLYIAGVRLLYPNVRGFLFNYIRTKAPTQPKLIKDGSRISAVRSIDTDYDTLKAFADKTGTLDSEVQDKLNILKHSPDRYFQRHYIIAPDSAVDMALSDTHEVLSEMSWKESGEGTYPRHVISKFAGAMACSKCEFQPLCHGELLGINTQQILLNYVERPQRETS